MAADLGEMKVIEAAYTDNLFGRPNSIRSHNCGELRIEHVGQEVTLCGWVQKTRDKNHFIFIDLRDRYGITQVVVFSETQPELFATAKTLGREYVVQVVGKVVEREAKNKERETGDIEVVPSVLKIVNSSKTPPFTIEDETDGQEEIRMEFRYLDIRRKPIQNRLIMRFKVCMTVRNYLSQFNFIEVETPVLIKSTPEGARDFVVPSRMNPGSFYALPQSPQIFKQLLMLAGMDRYFQIVKCFRDEELRADRQPEFTQIDCEMAMVDQEDVLNTFEGLTREVFKVIKGVHLPEFPRMKYDDAMRDYGIDKPDTRFEMKIKYLTDVAKGHGFKVFDDEEAVLALALPGLAKYSKSDIEKLTKLAKSGDIGAKHLIWCKHEAGGFKSSADKFFNAEALAKWAVATDSKEGDLIVAVAGPLDKTRVVMGRLRLALGKSLGFMDPSVYKPLWVLDFPLLEWDEDAKRWNSMHHPFTSPYVQHLSLLEKDPGAVRARAYDLVINGVEVGGGSIRIHDRQMQNLIFRHLGMSEETALSQFGFLLRAFEYGAPPHGGMAFGLDRLCTLLGEFQSIRDCIAFPKNNQGRDTMIKTPAPITDEQLKELFIKTDIPAGVQPKSAEGAVPEAAAVAAAAVEKKESES